MPGIDLAALNDSQRSVATRLDEPLFVAAGAGSGKTFTLTARLVHALSMGSAADGGRYLDSLDQALVITFTKAAAQEICERVRAALREAGEDDPHMHAESLKVDEAWISTIHGMCSRILRRHAIELGIDPAFTICEGSVGEALMARALDQVLSEAQRDPAYAPLFGEFALWGSGSSVVGLIGQLRSEATKCAEGFDGLLCPQSSETASCVQSLRTAFGSLEGIRLTAAQQQAVAQSVEALDAFCTLAPGKRTPAAACAALDAVKVPAIRKKDLKSYVDDIRQLLAEAKVCAQYERVQGLAPQLAALARAVQERYDALKLERSYLDNDDLIELALVALERHPEVARDYAGRFKLVMIDEFQDTDAKQVRLISLLAGENACHLTTVGDAQQSIYRFRGGDVTVFRERGDKLAQASHVEMDVNYRSDPNVLALVERVCGDAGLLEDFLKLAANGARTSKYRAGYRVGDPIPRIQLEVAAGATGPLMSATLAAQIADRLAACHAAGEPQSSMALLLGTTTRVEYYLDALRARGLDAVVTGGSSFSSTGEVGVVQALLHTLANPHDTQTGLFRLLSSQMFMLDANDFVELGSRRQSKLAAPTKRPVEQCFVDGTLELYAGEQPSERLVAAHRVLRRAFKRLASWQLADVCQAVIEESGWLRRLEAAGPDGLAHAANVLAAVRYVRELTQDLGLGIARAAVEFDQWLTAAKLTPKTLSGDVVDAVRVMTVHGSKGLQFGICAVAECWSNPSVAGGLSLGRKDGACTVVVVPHKVGKDFAKLRKSMEIPAAGAPCRSVAEMGLRLDAQEVEEQAGEKARLLYVALTRAEEALIVGLPIAQEEWRCSQLALGMLQALGVEDIAAGEQTLSYAPERAVEVEVRQTGPTGASIVRRPVAVEDGRLRVVELSRETKDAPWKANARGTLKGFDGELPDAVSRVPLLGTPAFAELAHVQGSEFALYPLGDPARVDYGWQPREEVFSYSSARTRMARRLLFAPAEARDDGLSARKQPRTPSRDEQDARAEGAPYTPDANKATALGSAFHALAQSMVETRRDHDPQRLRALARSYRLSERQTARLKAAIARWETSGLRREALRFAQVRAEVPFFIPAQTPYGSYAEGAIDLLCTDPDSNRALVVDYKTGDVGLSIEQIRAAHRLQAHFYAWVLRERGYSEVECAFCCVEVDDGAGGPQVVRYRFDADNRPAIA